MKLFAWLDFQVGKTQKPEKGKGPLYVIKIRGLALEAIDTLASLLKNSKSETTRLQVAKFILDTIKIAPKSDDLGLWYITGPTTVEDVIRKRLKDDNDSKLLIDYLGATD